MAEYFEDEAMQPEEHSGEGVRRKRVRRKRKRGGRSSSSNAAPVIGTKKERRSGDKKVKKEAIARLDLSGRHKLNTVQVIWVIVCGTVFFFAVGIISLDLIYNQENPDEVAKTDGKEAEVVPWAESLEQSSPDGSGAQGSPEGIPTIADFESTGTEGSPQGGRLPGADEAHALEIPKVEPGIELQRDNLIAQAYESRLYDQAIELGREELERNPSSPTVRYRLALAYRDSGDPHQAIDLLKEQLKRSEDPSVQLLCLIELAKMAESGVGDTAPLDYFDRAMEIDAGHPALLKEFSLYLRRNQRYQEGYYQTRRELARITPDHLARTRLKLAALQADHFDPYLEAHEKEVSRDEKTGFTCMTEAGRHIISGDAEKAIEWIRQARLKFGDKQAPFYAMVRDPIFKPVQAEFLEESVPQETAEPAAVEKTSGLPLGTGTGSFELEMPDDLTPLEQ
jgi:Tfp pilus assembly protein PilF